MLTRENDSSNPTMKFPTWLRFFLTRLSRRETLGTATREIQRIAFNRDWNDKRNPHHAAATGNP